MSYADKLIKMISRFAPEDRTALQEFCRTVFGPHCRQSDAEHFRWLFEQNPNVGEDGPQVWICRSDGQVVAQQAGIPFQLKVNSDTCRGSWAVDLMVRPAWRLRGIGAILNNVYSDHNDVTVSIGISDDAYRAFVRGGWIDLGTIPLFVRVIDCAEFLAVRWRRHVGRCVGSVIGVALKTIDALWSIRLSLTNVELNEIDHFDGWVDELWKSESPAYPVACRRDSSYLNWRYVERWRGQDGPSGNPYRMFYLTANERVVGYAVLRVGCECGVSVGRIVDYFCAPRWVGLLFAQCLRFFRRQKVTAVYCMHSSPAARSSLRWLGFACRKSGTQMMVKATISEPSVLRAVSLPGNWFVTSGDADCDDPCEDVHRREGNVS